MQTACGPHFCAVVDAAAKHDKMITFKELKTSIENKVFIFLLLMHSYDIGGLYRARLTTYELSASKILTAH